VLQKEILKIFRSRLPWLAHDEAPGPYITIPQYRFNKTKQHTQCVCRIVSCMESDLSTLTPKKLIWLDWAGVLCRFFCSYSVVFRLRLYFCCPLCYDLFSIYLFEWSCCHTPFSVEISWVFLFLPCMIRVFPFHISLISFETMICCSWMVISLRFFLQVLVVFLCHILFVCGISIFLIIPLVEGKICFLLAWDLKALFCHLTMCVFSWMLYNFWFFLTIFFLFLSFLFFFPPPPLSSPKTEKNEKKWDRTTNYVRSQILRLKTRRRLWITIIVRKKARKPRFERQRESGPTPVARSGWGAKAPPLAARPTPGCPSACLCVHLHGLGGARVVFPRPGSLWFWEAWKQNLYVPLPGTLACSAPR